MCAHTEATDVSGNVLPGLSAGSAPHPWPTATVTFALLAGLNFLQHMRTSPEGYAHFTLSGDYYNRALSGQYEKAYIVMGFKK